MSRSGSQYLVGEWVRLIPTLWTEGGEETFSEGKPRCSDQKKEGWILGRQNNIAHFFILELVPFSPCLTSQGMIEHFGPCFAPS